MSDQAQMPGHPPPPMQALYRGPGTTVAHRVAHAITVAVLSVRCLRWCPYSHAELVIDGRCYSSSARDGGVRDKVIDFTTGRWDLVLLLGVDAAAALQRYTQRKGLGYDWPGALRWGLPFLRQRPRADYCFEVVAHMLALPTPSSWTPLDMLDYFTDPLEA